MRKSGLRSRLEELFRAMGFGRGQHRLRIRAARDRPLLIEPLEIRQLLAVLY
jgi:hypothetical protein